MRLLLAMMKHETNTFSPVPTPLQRFRDWGLHEGDGVVTAYRGTNHPLAAYLDLAAETGAEIVTPIAAEGMPSGPVAPEAYSYLTGKILDALAAQGPFDAALLDLHGAMVPGGMVDGEGLLLQRMPAEGPSRVSGERNEDQIGRNEDFNRIAHLASTLTREELLTLEAGTLLHRLFWEERLLRYEPRRPRFACSCGRERVQNMLRGLGADEVQSIIAERGEVEVGCEFCGQRYRFDSIDAKAMFIPAMDQPSGLGSIN
jgi:hypothetical protein